ncbi:hypothetical protein PTI98_001243 [Pleurotus ostreatus]|nr:hypothetical protein PTI98_001243 [Pleurotus ostreatus]
MYNAWLLWTAVSNAARLSTVLQILIFLPLTLATLSTPAFLLLSLLLSVHSLIHGTMILMWGSEALSVLQVPMHPFLLLVCFNVFSSSVNPWLATITNLWGTVLKYGGPLFIMMEGLSSLLVAQKLGQEGKKFVGDDEVRQFGVLILTAIGYVTSAWWIAVSYPAAAVSPFLRLSWVLLLFLAYNVWLCGIDQASFSDPASSYAPLLPNILAHFQALLNFVTNTLPKPVLAALLYRLAILHLASRILPTIGGDSWESDEGVDSRWDDRPTSTLTRILLTYRQTIFVAVYSHLLLLDHSSQVWWRWMNVFFTLFIWGVELLVSNEDDEVAKDWKVD